MFWPIYIPTKGRARRALTPRILLAGSYKKRSPRKICLVIEPQEQLVYQRWFDSENLLVMDRNNGGLAYARQWIKVHALKNHPNGYHWQMDDDLKFRKRVATRNLPWDAFDLIEEVEEFVDGFSNIGLAGLRHSAFAFSQKGRFSVNKQISSCMLVKNSVAAAYDPTVVEDTDFSMQVLTEGWCTVIFNRLLYDNPPQGQQGGGCTDAHETKLYGYQQALCRKWNGNFEVELTPNRSVGSRIKPSRVWQTFKQTLERKHAGEKTWINTGR